MKWQLWQPLPTDEANSPIPRDKKEKRVTVIYNQASPLLDMEMQWDEVSREMGLQVFQKPNQALKYVDKASTHRPTAFKSIANGVLTQLARLTLNIAASRNKQIDKLYPDHREALFIVDLAPPMDFSSYGELWQADGERKN
eukprot:13696150-Ditylum_brightwellii.AAC.1